MNVGKTFALAVGVLLIVGGVGAAYSGYNQSQAASEWSSTTHDCGSTIGDPSSVDCPDNPHKGGEGDIFLGAVAIVVGAVSARYGASD